MRSANASPPQAEKTGHIHIQITADVNIGAPIARRLVNVELMKKVGQMIMPGEPEVFVDGEKVYWKVPLLVVPPDEDRNIYPTGRYALVDALSGLYSMSRSDIEELKAASEPILRRLYPDLDDWVEKVEKARSR